MTSQAVNLETTRYASDSIRTRIISLAMIQHSLVKMFFEMLLQLVLAKSQLLIEYHQGRDLYFVVNHLVQSIAKRERKV